MSAGTSLEMQHYTLLGILTIFPKQYTRLKYVTNLLDKSFYVVNVQLVTIQHSSKISIFRIELVASLQAVFEQTVIEAEAVPAPTPSAFGAMASFLVPKLSVGLAGGLSNERSSNSVEQCKLQKEPHAIRPPVKHNWSLPGSGRDQKPPQIFQHELVQNFSFNMFCKVQRSVELFKYLVAAFTWG